MKISHLEEINCHCHHGGGGQPIPGRVTELHLVKAGSQFQEVPREGPSRHFADGMPGKNVPDFTGSQHGLSWKGP